MKIKRTLIIPGLMLAGVAVTHATVIGFGNLGGSNTAVPAALFAKNRVRTQTDVGWPRGQPAQGAWCWTDRNGDGAASFILARIKPGDELLLVRQFRPPTGDRIARRTDRSIVECAADVVSCVSAVRRTPLLLWRRC